MAGRYLQFKGPRLYLCSLEYNCVKAKSANNNCQYSRIAKNPSYLVKELVALGGLGVFYTLPTIRP